MIKPFEIIREDVREDGTLVLYSVTKTQKTENGLRKKNSITSTIFVGKGLNTEEELVKNLIQGGWL